MPDRSDTPSPSQSLEFPIPSGPPAVAHRLYAMGNGTRFYDPDLGQFLEKDPVYGDESEPRSLSPYAYSFNNPVWYMDPTGLQSERKDEDKSLIPSPYSPDVVTSSSQEEGLYKGGVYDFESLTQWKSGKNDLFSNQRIRHHRRHHPRAKQAAQLPIITTPQPPPSTVPSNANLPPHGVTLEPTPETTAPEPPRPVEATVTQPGTTWSQTVDEFVGAGRKLYDTLDDYGIISKAQIRGGIRGFENGARGALSAGAGYLTHPIDTFRQIHTQNADTLIDLVTALGDPRALYEGAQAAGWEGFDEIRGEIGGTLAFGEVSEAALWGAVSPPSARPLTIFDGQVPYGTVPTRAWGPCFVAGTPVAVLGGLQAIETLKAGDWAASFNEQTKQVEYKPITAIYQHLSKEVLNLTIEGEAAPIRTTPQHPFYVYHARSNLFGEKNDEDDCGWMEAGDLRPGDLVRNAAGEWVKVLAVGEREPGEWVYNFTVDQNHTYFVGSQGILVHNTNPVNPCAQTAPITDPSRLLPAPRGNPNPIGEKGPFRVDAQGNVFIDTPGQYIPDTPLDQLPRSEFYPDGLPLPHPDAVGPHTVLGRRVGGTTERPPRPYGQYRQSVEFRGPTWPAPQGQQIPLREVDWTNHARGDHTNPHQHGFYFDPSNKGRWRRGPQVPFEHWKKWK